MKYYLKKTLTLYRQDNKICVGQVNDLDNYLELDYNSLNLQKIENIIINGISKEEDDLYFDLFYSKGFLEKNRSLTEKRNNLFSEYVSNKKVNESLFEKKILVVGAGGGGGTIVYMLAQFGFTNISVIDFDYVEFSDVDKTMVYDKSMIGRFKVDALKEKILLNFSIEISTFNNEIINKKELDNFIELIKPQFIVKAADPKGIFLKNLNIICFEKKIPFIQMAYSYESLKIGPILVPEITSCNEFINQENIKFYGEHYQIEKFERIFNNNFIHPSVSFNINILSSLILKEIVFFLLEKYEFCQTIGRMIILNTLNFDKQTYLFNCNESCNVCK